MSKPPSTESLRSESSRSEPSTAAPPQNVVAERRPLHLWPGILIVAVQWIARFVVPTFWPEATIAGVIIGILGGFAVVGWWLFLSRAAWVERLGALALMIAGLALTPRILHESVATAGQGALFFVYAIPTMSLALVVWAVATRDLSDGRRRILMVASLLFACGGWALVRTGGVTGDANSDFAWRWSPTPEERLLAAADDLPVPAAAPANDVVAPVADAAAWSGFRGARRNAVISGVRLDADWEASPPIELWRRPVGPGWSSFAVGADLFFTQEQRGEEELVSAYRVATGEPVWSHRDTARFWESNGGAGPRATPTLHGDLVYALGATGLLNALAAADGSVVWSRNAAAELDKDVPGWGFSGSPLVVDDLVIVALAGALAAYDAGNGEPRWVGPDGGGGYSSPQLLTLDGVEQVLLMSGAGPISIDPANGELLWEHEWRGAPIVQPAGLADGGLLVSSSGDTGGMGVRRLAVAKANSGWTVHEQWTSLRLKPYFSDLAVHQGNAYGFDGSIMASVSLENGERNWKGGRYGHGQLLLLADQDLLLVLAEDGDLVLVRAAPEEFTEVARVEAIAGKTWNHPVLVDDVLLVRNDQEMAAFRLSRLR